MDQAVGWWGSLSIVASLKGRWNAQERFRCSDGFKRSHSRAQVGLLSVTKFTQSLFMIVESGSL